MSSVITFENHSPIRVADADLIETVWDQTRSFGHRLLKRYTTKRGQSLYWMSQHSGSGDETTTRHYLSDIEAVREFFIVLGLDEEYSSEVEALIDPESIIDVDTLA